MRFVEKYYSVTDVAVLIDMHPKTICRKMKEGEFGKAVVNLGSEERPDYRIPSSGVNAYLDARRLFFEDPHAGEQVPAAA